MLQQDQLSVDVATSGQGFYDITETIQDWLQQTGLEFGKVTVFVRHTSASLTIQENADPDVVADLDSFLDRLAPANPALYRHMLEGPDDMPAHIRSMVTTVSLTIPFDQGRMMLGTWQAVYLVEHRRDAQVRQLVLHAIGE